MKMPNVSLLTNLVNELTKTGTLYILPIYTAC